MSALQIWPDHETSDIGAQSGYRRRTSSRVNNPKLCVTIRGKLYQSINWSLGGILVGDYDGVLVAGDMFEIDSIGRAGKKNWPVLISARVIRTGGETGMDLAAQFITISAPAFDILEGILLRRPQFQNAS
ncbi:hypothetical protein L2D14_11205 [Thalassospiraceae bacterium LMO-JJ14]|nr:hypothetical protein L2D14_11205 [Thalassospiraceae bacterium LMO-JJ14]